MSFVLDQLEGMSRYKSLRKTPLSPTLLFIFTHSLWYFFVPLSEENPSQGRPVWCIKGFFQCKTPHSDGFTVGIFQSPGPSSRRARWWITGKTLRTRVRNTQALLSWPSGKVWLIIRPKITGLLEKDRSWGFILQSEFNVSFYTYTIVLYARIFFFAHFLTNPEKGPEAAVITVFLQLKFRPHLLTEEPSNPNLYYREKFLD